MNKLQINLTLEFEIPKEKITIDSVLYTVNETSSKVSIAITKAFLSGFEEKAVEEEIKNNPSYVRNGHQPRERQIRASFGSFSYRLAQLYDSDKGKTIIPLKHKLKWPDYRRYMNESIQGSGGLVTYLSYNKSVNESKRMLGTDISTSTFHRMLNLFSENYCKWPKQKRVKYRFLMADGTKVRLQAGKGKDLGKGEMRWVMASRGEGKPFYPVGFWINTAWRDIKEELKETINYNNLEVLFADGEKEIQGLLEKGMRFQRCVFHGKKDFAHKLYLDGFKKNKQKGLKDDLAALPVFRFKQENLEKLKEEDKRKVKKLINKSKQGLDDLLKVLDPEKYSNARSYISNLKKHLFTFFDYWLKDGEWVPLTTNAIEGAFSRVKNRIWSIGRRWTERGLLNWLRITIQKIFSPNKWDNFWKKYLKINPNLKLSYLGASWQWIDQNHVTLK